MNKVSGRLQVFFEAPFWVGVFERVVDGELSLLKKSAGTEATRKDCKEMCISSFKMLAWERNHSRH